MRYVQLILKVLEALIVPVRKLPDGLVEVSCIMDAYHVGTTPDVVFVGRTEKSSVFFDENAGENWQFLKKVLYTPTSPERVKMKKETLVATFEDNRHLRAWFPPEGTTLLHEPRSQRYYWVIKGKDGGKFVLPLIQTPDHPGQWNREDVFALAS